MELKQLRNFVKIVEEGNITKAAQKLNMAQPPLSTQMQQLETELDAILFKRGARNIILTDAGYMVYEKAKTILKLSDQIPDDINSLDSAAMILRLGIISSVSNYLPDILLPAFIDKYINFNYDLLENNTYQLIEALFSNIVELAIVRTPFQNTGLACYPILKNSMYAIGRTKFFGSVTEDVITLKSLGDSPLIIYRRWEDILRKYCKANAYKPQFRCINEDARTTLQWAEAGLGIGIVPESIISKNTAPDMVIKPLLSPALSSDIMLVHVKGKSLSFAAKEFVAHIQKKEYI